MPLRCMNYDVQEYLKQLRRLQAGNDRTGVYRTPSERLCRLPLDYEIRMPETGRDGLHRPPRSILFSGHVRLDGSGTGRAKLRTKFFQICMSLFPEKNTITF